MKEHTYVFEILFDHTHVCVFYRAQTTHLCLPHNPKRCGKKSVLANTSLMSQIMKYEISSKQTRSSARALNEYDEYNDNRIKR